MGGYGRSGFGGFGEKDERGYLEGGLRMGEEERVFTGGRVSSTGMLYCVYLQVQVLVFDMAKLYGHAAAVPPPYA